MMRKIIFISLCLLIINSCKKKDDMFFNIVLLDTSPTSIQEFQENIVVEIEFEHSQGFLGFYDPDYLMEQ